MNSYNFYNFKIEILYEDNDLAILNKPSGLLTHKKNLKDQEISLCQSIMDKYNIKDDEPFKEGIVHRLDKNTSGIIIIAKNKTIKNELKLLFKNRKINKTYKTYVLGNFINKEKFMESNIARQSKNRMKFKISQDEGKNSLTIVNHIKTFFGSISLLECKIVTGRTHQIRVHLSSSGFPLIGDRSYQKTLEQKFALKNLPNEVKQFIELFPRQALHSSHINFIHPFTKKNITIECELPLDLKKLDKVLRNG